MVETLIKTQFLVKESGPLMHALGKAWVTLFTSIRAAPLQRKIPPESIACLEKALLRLYKDLHVVAPHLADHLASTEASLVFMKLEPTVKVGNMKEVASAMKAKLGGVIVERLLQCTINEVVHECERRKIGDLRKRSQTQRFESPRGSTVVSKLKGQAKLAGRKQDILKGVNVKGDKKMAIVKERASMRLVKELTAKTKNCMTSRVGNRRGSLEEMRRRLPPGVTLSLSPAVKTPESKPKNNSFEPRIPILGSRAPMASPRFSTPRMLPVSPGTRMPGPNSHLLRGPMPRLYGVRSPKTSPTVSKTISARPITPKISMVGSAHTRPRIPLPNPKPISPSLSITKYTPPTQRSTCPRYMAPTRRQISPNLLVTKIRLALPQV